MLAPPTLWVSRRRVFTECGPRQHLLITKDCCRFSLAFPTLPAAARPQSRLGQTGMVFVNVGAIPAPSGSASWRDATEKHTAFSRRPCQLLHNKLETSADLSSAQGSNVRAAAAELGWIHGLDPVRDFSVPSINRWIDSNQTLSHRRSPPLLLAKNSLKSPRETI